MFTFHFAGASTSMRDNLHGNTPLHWALLSKNLNAVTTLVTKFNVDIQAVNLQGHSCLDLYKNHVKKARDQRLSKEGKADLMFYPRKVAEKFEASLPPNWFDDAAKVPHAKSRFCPSFIVKFFGDKKVRKRSFPPDQWLHKLNKWK